MDGVLQKLQTLGNDHSIVFSNVLDMLKSSKDKENLFQLKQLYQFSLGHYLKRLETLQDKKGNHAFDRNGVFSSLTALILYLKEHELGFQKLPKLAVDQMETALMNMEYPDYFRKAMYLFYDQEIKNSSSLCIHLLYGRPSVVVNDAHELLKPILQRISDDALIAFVASQLKSRPLLELKHFMYLEPRVLFPVIERAGLYTLHGYGLDEDSISFFKEYYQNAVTCTDDSLLCTLFRLDAKLFVEYRGYSDSLGYKNLSQLLLDYAVRAGELKELLEANKGSDAAVHAFIVKSGFQIARQFLEFYYDYSLRRCFELKPKDCGQFYREDKREEFMTITHPFYSHLLSKEDDVDMLATDMKFYCKDYKAKKSSEILFNWDLAFQHPHYLSIPAVRRNMKRRPEDSLDRIITLLPYGYYLLEEKEVVELLPNYPYLLDHIKNNASFLDKHFDTLVPQLDDQTLSKYLSYAPKTNPRFHLLSKSWVGLQHWLVHFEALEDKLEGEALAFYCLERGISRNVSVSEMSGPYTKLLAGNCEGLDPLLVVKYRPHVVFDAITSFSVETIVSILKSTSVNKLRKRDIKKLLSTTSLCRFLTSRRVFDNAKLAFLYYSSIKNTKLDATWILDIFKHSNNPPFHLLLPRLDLTDPKSELVVDYAVKRYRSRCKRPLIYVAARYCEMRVSNNTVVNTPPSLVYKSLKLFRIHDIQYLSLLLSGKARAHFTDQILPFFNKNKSFKGKL